MLPRSIRTPLLILLISTILSACSSEGWIAAYFPNDYSEARQVAFCESRLDPDAVSPGGGNHGLFQINNVHRQSFTEVTGQPWSQVYHPAYNAWFAKWLYDQSGWRPWTCRP